MGRRRRAGVLLQRHVSPDWCAIVLEEIVRVTKRLFFSEISDWQMMCFVNRDRVTTLFDVYPISLLEEMCMKRSCIAPT